VKNVTEKLATIRCVPDDLWLEILPILGEEKAENYLGLVQLAFCVVTYRRVILG